MAQVQEFLKWKMALFLYLMTLFTFIRTVLQDYLLMLFMIKMVIAQRRKIDKGAKADKLKK